MDIARELVQRILAQSSNTTCRQRPTEAVVIEILDAKGKVLNSYNSETPVLRGGRGTGGPAMPGVGTAGPESQPRSGCRAHAALLHRHRE